MLALTDPHDDAASPCCLQRRRWLNGAFFASAYSLMHFGQLMRTNHSVVRKLVFCGLFAFNLTQSVVSWLGTSLLFLSTSMIISQGLYYAPFGAKEFRLLFVLGYLGLLGFLLLAGLVGRVNQMAQSYTTAMLVLTVIMVVTGVLGAWLLFQGDISVYVGFAFAAAVGTYILAAALHGALLKALLFFPQYMSTVPLSLVLFPIHSFAVSITC